MKRLNQTRCPAKLFVIVCTAALLSGCKDNNGRSPQGYDLNKPIEMQLGKVLNEISGISYHSDRNSLMAISDSKEKIFEIRLKNNKLKDYTGRVFPPDSDLEDIVVFDTTVFALSSSGIIKEVQPGGEDTSSVRSYQLPISGTNDFETIYYDPSAKGLILLCKSCAHEKGQRLRTAYRFDLQSRTFDTTAFYSISKDDVENLLKDKDAKFDPSAAAINPIDKRLYILSSAGTLLVVADTRGKVIEGYNLNPDRFPQAEGIAFAPNGDMYITNEGKFGKPTLLLFRYQNGNKKNK
jgi:uncharacterized protein YjiK